MIAITVPVNNSENAFSHENAAAFVQLMSHFDSAVMLHDANRVINGKSLLGLLSLGIISSKELKLFIDGPDEDEAAVAICDYFPEAYQTAQ